jgi:hypothetical protein
VSYKNEFGIYVSNDSIECDRYSFEGSAESIKAYIDSVVEQAKERGMVGDGSFDLHISYGMYDTYDIEMTYYFTRIENDKEKAAREKEEAKKKEATAKKRKATAEKKKLKADAEYAEFLRLKEKFGAIENE